ncbi:succinyl-diaminopimelate desuccinylase [Rhodobacteraceae bacterium]|nr:succinyl-diaminopimelate desuccinylase [Paracoccaceae bacterium]
MTIDPIELSARLIQCPSVTPQEAGALSLLSDMLEAEGFACTRVDRNGTPNLFARWGRKGAARSFGFNGHTDVVPVGSEADWSQPPFSGAIIDGVLWGRGATDMKTGVAAFAAAAIDFVRETPPDGAIILAITGDEEGPGRDGTRALLDWMAAEDEAMSVCLVGEPTCPETMGEMIKIGRRGSITFDIAAEGIQGHVAYPHRAKNPLHALVRLLDLLAAEPLDQGTAHFDPSSLQITTIDCANPATNVVPARATARLNIRFNDAHTGASLTRWIEGLIAQVGAQTGVTFTLDPDLSGESFFTPPGPFVDLVSGAVAAECGVSPVLSTSGGTSDARFVKDHCPVVEFGLVGKTMHQVDERIEVSQIITLKAIYHRILRSYFA